MPNQPSERDKVIENVYQTKKALIQSTSEHLGEPAGARALTAEEMAHAWKLPDMAADVDQLWIETMAEVVKGFPGMTVGQAREEARPIVGMKLYKWRPELAAGDGRGSLTDQAEWSQRFADRLAKGTDTDTETPAESTTTGEEADYG